MRLTALSYQSFGAKRMLSTKTKMHENLTKSLYELMAMAWKSMEIIEDSIERPEAEITQVLDDDDFVKLHEIFGKNFIDCDELLNEENAKQVLGFSKADAEDSSR